MCITDYQWNLTQREGEGGSRSGQRPDEDLSLLQCARAELGLQCDLELGCYGQALLSPARSDIRHPPVGRR